MKTVYSVTGTVKIKNEKGTSDRSCECASWLAHWEKFSRKTAKECSVAGCEKRATDGAHVTRPSAENEAYKTHPYIVPMCSSHNGEHGAVLTSKESVTFVWANVKETCGK